MKQVTLNHIHEGLGAKMVPFAGFSMPVQYEGVNAEHETVRNGVGVFDVSHMGIFKLSGPNALSLIQKVTSNDASTLVDGKAQYCYFPNEKGGVIDDIITYRINENEYLMVVNASNIEKDWTWINQHNQVNATLENLSDSYSILAIQGPKAVEAMQSLTTVNLTDLKFYNFTIDTFAGAKDVVISAMGYCLYGNELNDEISPLEAGLGWVTKFTKDFISADILKAQKEAGLQNKLVGFELVEKGIPRHDYEIVDATGAVIGKVTSGTMSPSLGKGIGMGYVTLAHAAEGSTIYIRIRKNDVEAKVVKTPFYKK